MYRGMLELAGYGVLYTRDGEIAAKICEEHSSEIDLLLSDVLIPGKNGADLSLSFTIAGLGSKSSSSLAIRTRTTFSTAYSTA
jgi:DNA-binding NtrC family response regulator